MLKIVNKYYKPSSRKAKRFNKEHFRKRLMDTVWMLKNDEFSYSSQKIEQLETQRIIDSFTGEQLHFIHELTSAQNVYTREFHRDIHTSIGASNNIKLREANAEITELQYKLNRKLNIIREAK